TYFNEMLIKSTNTSTIVPLSNLITDIYGSNARVITTQEIAQTASTIIGAISTLLLLIAGISLVVAAIGIMNIMLIAVYERTHEIGILKSVGFKDKDILTIFLCQALIIGFVGGIVGVGVGAGGSYTLTTLISASQSSPSNTNSSASSSGARFGNNGPGGTFASGSSSSSSSLSFSPVFSISTILTALIVAMTVSVIAGVYPAWRASKLEPIDALRQL
ncbi:MAG: ABC transporter permease, partial [Candidatus Micrarchaeales archaeon]